VNKQIGFVIVYDNGKEKRIFLTKPMDANWTGTFTIPKVDIKGSPFGTLRDYMYKEYKLVLKQNEIPRVASPFRLSATGEEAELLYYIFKIDNLKFLKVNSFIFPKFRLPEDQEWASLVPWEQAWGRIKKSQRKLLRHLEILMRNDWKIYNKFYSK